MLKRLTLFLFAAAAVFVAWNRGWQAPAAVVDLQRVATPWLPLGAAVAAGLVGLWGAVSAARAHRRLSRRDAGQRAFEDDIVRRLAAVEAGLAAMHEDFRREAAAAGQARTKPADPPDPEPVPAERDCGDPAPALAAGSRLRPVADAELAELVAGGAVTTWFQPVVGLPERVTRFLDCQPYLQRDGEAPLEPAYWLAQAEAAGLTAEVCMRLVHPCLRLARRLGHEQRDCAVIVPLPAAALEEGEKPDRIEATLLSNSGVAGRVVLRLSERDLDRLSVGGWDRLGRLSRAGFRLAMQGARDVAALDRAARTGNFHLLMAAATQLQGDFGRDGAARSRLFAWNGETGNEIVATGLETEEAAMEMIDLDILCAQGPLFSGPRPLRADASPLNAVRGAAVAGGRATADYG